MSSAKRVVIGLSGGVDSAVAAYFLLQKGYDVRAAFMKNFSERVGKNKACPWKEDRLMAYRVASHLGIAITTWDFEKEYHDKVLNYMVTEYSRGRTPNPDIMCNKEIKFKLFLDTAQKAGAALIATGHYARVRKDASGCYHLHKGQDPDKDQSYFLAALNQTQLRHVLFPLGNIIKPEVRKFAKKLKLPNADRPDSQGICFVGKVSMDMFLKKYIKPKKGKVLDTSGNILGEHDGVYYYTIGQRRGINIGGGSALYVIDKDIKRNQLIVGTADQLEMFRKVVRVGKWHWLVQEHRLPLSCKAKIRYRQKDQAVTLHQSARGIMKAVFLKPQRAVSPGQTLVAYKGTELIGSGIID